MGQGMGLRIRGSGFAQSLSGGGRTFYRVYLADFFPVGVTLSFDACSNRTHFQIIFVHSKLGDIRLWVGPSKSHLLSS
jgi:hypothetical protein